MILVAYRHGLRASEVCGLRWDQIDLNSGRLHVRRAKGGIDNVHQLSGREIRALRHMPFKHLNGKMSLQIVLKKDANFPLIPGILAPKPERYKRFRLAETPICCKLGRNQWLSGECR